MPDPAPSATLTPDDAGRLAEFSRVCKAAARAVSLYPGGHPAIGVSLQRLEQTTARMTQTGPYSVQVLAEGLLVDGARMPKPDAAVSELATLLHRHLVGRLTLNAGANAESWRTLMLLLARAPEDVRADGGLAKLWATAGGPSLEIIEIDYSEVLREKQGLAATIDAIIAAAMSGPTLTVDEAALKTLLEIVDDPAKLEALMTQLEQTSAKSPQGVELQTATLLNMVRGLAEYVSRTEPQRLNEVFEKFGRGARHLSVEAMISLLSERKRPEAMAGSVNVVSALIESMSDTSIAGFVADSIVAERGASERLAHAFRALVPEFDRQRQLLALAREEVASSELAREQDQEEFRGLWNGVEQMLTSVHGCPVCVRGLRARALARADAAGRRRARERRSARAHRVVAGDGQRQRAAFAGSEPAAGPPQDRERSVALARRGGHRRHARGRSRPGRPLRRRLAVDRHGCRRGIQESVPSAARGDGARDIRQGIAPQARGAPPANGNRRGRRAVRHARSCDRPVDHRPAGRIAGRRTGRPIAAAAARHSDRFWTARRGVDPSPDERAELGGPPHRCVPPARVRRRRQPEGAGAPAHRFRAARPAGSRAGPGDERQQGSGGHPPQRPRQLEG